MKYCEICHKELADDFDGNICEECQNETKLTPSSPIYTIMFVTMIVAFICLSVICAFMAFKSNTWLFISLGIFVFFAVPVTLLTISYIKAKSNDEQIRRIILISYILSALMLIALAILSVLLFGA